MPSFVLTVLGVLVAKSLLAENIIAGKVFLSNAGPGIATAAALLAPSLLFRRRARAYAAFADFAASLLLLADVVYSRGFEGCVSLHSLSSANVFADVADSAAALLRWTDVLWFADIPLLCLWSRCGFRTGAWRVSFAWRCAYFPFTVLTCVLCLNLAIEGWETTTLVTQESSWVECLTPLGYHYYDVCRFVRERTATRSDADRERVAEWLKANSVPENRAGAPRYARLEGILDGKNLLMIHAESLEGFLVGYSIDGQEVTPNLNRLAERSLVFENVYEQVGNGNSSDAELMALTSWYPVGRGSAFLRFGDADYQSLPKALKTLGYKSFAIHGDEAKFWNRENVFKAMGFDDYVSEEDFGEFEQFHMGVDDRDYYAKFAEVCSVYSEKGPYFAYGISLTSHLPFVVDEPRRLLRIDGKGHWADYLQSQRYHDECLGEFVRTMRGRGLLKNTVLAVFGDHQGIHKYYPGDTGPLPENARRVPFLVYCEDVDFTAPGLLPEGASRVSAPGGQVDILPTLTYLFGIGSVTNSEGRALDGTMMGRSLLRPGADEGGLILWDGTEIGVPDELQRNARKIIDLML